MKKRRFLPILRRKDRVAGIVTGLSLIAAGIVYAEMETGKEEVVQAHPTSTITLDPGGVNELTLPKDGSQIWETGLSAQYDDFVQTKEKVASLELKNAIPQQYQINYNFPKNQIELANGNRITLWLQDNSQGILNAADPERWLIKAGIALLNSDGRIIKEIEFDTGGAVNHNELVPSVLNSSTVSNILKNTDGTYSALYNVSNQGYNSQAKVLVFNDNLTVVSRSTINIGLTSNSRIYYTNNYLDAGAGNLYQLGYMVFGNQSSLVSDFPLFRYNPASNTYTTEVTLKLPPFQEFASCPNPDSYSTAIKLLGNIMKTSDNGYLAQLQYSSWDGAMPASETGIALAKFDAAGNYVGKWQADVPNRSISMINAISTPDKIYVQVMDSTETRLLCLENGVTMTSIIDANRLPANTNLKIFKNIDTYYETTYEFYGTTPSNSGDFARLTSGGTVIGAMTDTFDMKNVQLLSAGSATFNDYTASSSDSSNILFSGASQDQSFATEVPSLRTSPTTAPVGPGWVSWYKTSRTFGVAGNFKKVDDFAPLMVAGDDILVNISSQTIQSPTSTTLNNWNSLDRWLITGEENGTLSSAGAIKVFDTVTSNHSSYGQNWLEKMINRNYKNPTAAIDWQALGFDKTTTGPQLVSYFVSDNQLQLTTVSRWINKKSAETIIKNDYALDAQNFAIAWSDIATDIIDSDDFKTLAKTMAWDMDSHVVDEDGAAGSFDAKVTVDAAQLADLQQAAVTKEAKPYPVDVTYDSNGDGSLLLTNRVWVFVTTKNTVVDKTNGIVIYADDYTLPIQLAQSETKGDVYPHADVKVYDYYDTSHESSEPLTPLADKVTTTGLDVTNLTVITGATGAAVVQPEIAYTSSTGTTTAKPDVKITASVLFHLRQVVYANPITELDQLVIPTEGYLDLVNTSVKQMDITVPSGEEAANPAYEDFYAEVDNTGGNNKLSFDVVVPQYYNYMGYVVSNTATVHQPTALTGTNIYQYDFTSGIYEQWITVYIQPYLENGEPPKPYSWDYNTNEFGSIQVP